MFGFSLQERLVRDKQTAMQYLPTNTRFQRLDSANCFVYTISSEYGDSFTLAAYFDGSLYKVALLNPKLEGKLGAHQAHLFSNGTLCLNKRGGERDLRSAFSKSVLWATGISVVLRGGVFPFARDQ
jgi:hypothetical protein